MSTRALSKELQEKAIKDLNEDPTRIQSDLVIIREWAEKQPHLKIRTDDQWLLSMLRGCKFSLERTKEKLDLLCTVKTLLPDYFNNRDPFLPELQEILKIGVCLPLSKTSDPASPRVIIMRAESVDPATMKVEDGAKLFTMILEILLMEDDNFVVAGTYIFLDDKGVTLNHIMKITPEHVKKAYTCFQKAYAVRPKCFYAINVPQYAEAVYDMFKWILTEKLQSRVQIFRENNMDDLYERIPKSILPKEYGGDGDSLEELTIFWKEKVESYKHYFLDDAKYCSDETKRPGKARTTYELCGVAGSFRQLNLD